MLEEHELLSLRRDQLNDAQVLILMIEFQTDLGDAELKTFLERTQGFFAVHPATSGSSPDERRRWAMHEHYEADLIRC